MTDTTATPIETYYGLLNAAQHAAQVIVHFDHLPGSEPIFQALQDRSVAAQQALIKFIVANSDAVLASLPA
jgi:hypothetical protein